MKIAIAGAAGRMGQMLIQEIARTPGCSFAAALEGPGSKALGTDAGGGVKIVSDAAAAIGAAGFFHSATTFPRLEIRRDD